MAENTAVNSSFPNDSKGIREVGEHSHIKLTAGDIIFNILNYLFFGLFTLSCIFPFYYIFINTISNPELVTRGAITLIPKELTIQNYISMGAVGDLWKSVLVTVLRTVIGTALMVFVSSLAGYLVTKKEMWHRQFWYRFLVVTMYFNAGLIPWYLNMSMLGLVDAVNIRLRRFNALFIGVFWHIAVYLFNALLGLLVSLCQVVGDLALCSFRRLSEVSVNVLVVFLALAFTHFQQFGYIALPLPTVVGK